jgi:hypothetical protein
MSTSFPVGTAGVAIEARGAEASVPENSVVILGLVPRIHDFLARPRSRGWPAFADHDGVGRADSTGRTLIQ